MRPLEKILIGLLLITFLANLLFTAALTGWLSFSLLNLLALILVLHLAVERSRALLPRRWLVRILGRMNFGSVAIAGAASTASMM